jgi:hypothetical protein
MLERDAPPSDAFLGGCHLRPQLHFFKAAATAFADLVALAGGANGNAGRVGGAVVPGFPSLVGRLGHGGVVGFVKMVEHHKGVYLGQCTGFGRQGDAIGRGLARAPKIDGRLDVGDVNACHKVLHHTQRCKTLEADAESSLRQAPSVQA